MRFAKLLGEIAPGSPVLLTQCVDADFPPGTRFDDKTIGGKIEGLARTFHGKPLACLYHAAVIASLRRGIDPLANCERFLALWQAHGEWLLPNLDSRWLISAADTLADIHPDPNLRAAGLAVSAALNVLRLAETERRARGTDLRPLGRRQEARYLHDGLREFAIGRGDTIANLDARIARIRAEGTLPGRILAELMSRAQAGDTVLRRLSDAHDDNTTRWARRSAPRLRVALFNDTSTRAHFGCDAVTESINHLLGDAGIEIGWRHHVTANALDDPGTLSAIAAHDAIVVNGEGTIHSNRKKARALAALGRMAKAAGRKAWLVNATLQDNDAAIVADLAAFDHIWVREGASARWARERGLSVTLMPDLSFCRHMDLAEGPAPGHGTVLIDSVLPEANLALYRMTRSFGGALWKMSRDAEGRMQTLRPKPARESGQPKRLWVQDLAFVPEARGGPRDLDAFAAFLVRRSAMVTGRFHAVCFAMLLRMPFHAIPSNTWKIEAMLADAGIDPARLLDLGAAAPAPLPFSGAELAAIDRYVARARFEAGAMVERILSGY